MIYVYIDGNSCKTTSKEVVQCVQRDVLDNEDIMLCISDDYDLIDVPERPIPERLREEVRKTRICYEVRQNIVRHDLIANVAISQNYRR
jgi:hypothetical protein